MLYPFLVSYKHGFYQLTFVVGHMLRILYSSKVDVGVRWMCVGCALDCVGASVFLRRFCVGICVGALDTLRRYLRWFCVGSALVLNWVCVGALVLLRWLQYPTQRSPMLGKLKNSLNSLISHKLKCIQLMICTIKQGA